MYRPVTIDSTPLAAERPADAPDPLPSARRPDPLLVILLALGAGTILRFALVHVDDVDSAVYTVIARNVARTGRLFELHYLSTVWPVFHEHPPLYFWVEGAFIRAASTLALPWVGGIIGLLTVATTYLLGARLVGRRAAFLGTACLCLTEEFFRYQARPRLDPPLVLAFTAAVALIVLARGRLWMLALGGLVAGIGALVKGPPALGAPVAALLLLLAMGDRGDLRRPVAWLTVAVSTSVIPVLFLLYDASSLGGAWWHGYVEDQFIASTLGSRHDGWADHGYLLRDLLGAFWPGMPFVAVGLILAALRRRTPLARAVAGLAAWAALVVGAFSVAGRALWWYSLPAFPALSLIAGVGADVLVRRGGERAFRIVQGVIAGAAAVLVLLIAVPLPLFPVARCTYGPLAALAAARVAPGSSIGLVGNTGPGEVAWLAEHADRDVVPMKDPRELATHPRIAVVVMSCRDAARLDPAWQVRETHGAWALAVRAPF